LLTVPSALAVREFSVGVSPQVVDLGNVSIGTKIVRFYIVTISDEPLLVYLEPANPLLDFFDNPSYKNLLYNYSEEQVLSWVELLSNPVELTPSGDSSAFGGNVKGWREINFLLNVPSTAEPGYHLFRVIPRPSVPEGGAAGQVGVKVATIVPVNILFSVPGKAVRQGKILDITGEYVRNNLALHIHFLNTGTVTISASASRVEVYDSKKNMITSGSSDVVSIKPGEKKVLTAMLPISGVKYGEYDVYAKVSYLTGYTEKNSTVSLYPPTEIPPAKPIEIPWWLIVLIIFLIIFLLLYKYEKD
jgi:hypothetical protein